METVKKISIILCAILLTACTSQLDMDVQINASGEQVVYAAISGESALSTLKRFANVNTQTEDFGEFVIAIDGIEGNGDVRFWAFFVNGKKSREGASSYIAKPGDIFEWRLTKRKED